MIYVFEGSGRDLNEPVRMRSYAHIQTNKPYIIHTYANISFDFCFDVLTLFIRIRKEIRGSVLRAHGILETREADNDQEPVRPKELRILRLEGKRIII